MSTWFEVENFKSIRKLHIELRPFMTLVGANGAGKTNVVQALSVALDIVTAGTTAPIELYGGYEQLIRRGKRPARSMRFALRMPYAAAIRSPKGYGTMQVAFSLRPHPEGEGAIVADESLRIEDPSGKVLADVRWSSRGPEGIDLVGLRRLREGQNLLPLTTNRIEEWLKAREPEVLRLCALYNVLGLHRPAQRVRRLRLESSAVRADSIPGEARGLGAQDLAGKGLPLAIERLRPRDKPSTMAFKRVLAGLQEIYSGIEDVKTIRFQPGRRALSFKERNIDGELGEASVSDGVMHALALLVALEEERGHHGILAVEEPENALHPWALRRILELAQDRSGKAGALLVTTHSPVAVDAVKDPAALFVVEKDPKRGTTVTPALEKERALRAILAESGQKLGDVWLGGTIGGVPRAGT